MISWHSQQNDTDCRSFGNKDALYSRERVPKYVCCRRGLSLASKWQNMVIRSLKTALPLATRKIWWAHTTRLLKTKCASSSCCEVNPGRACD